MKTKITYITTIIFFVVLVIVLGFLALRGCISPSMAQYWILGFTLIAVLLYAYSTDRILEIQRVSFHLSRNPILGSYIEPQLILHELTDPIPDFKTIFHIKNFSGVHAVAKIDINPKLNGKPAKTNDSYSGKRWWYVPALKDIQGNFPLVEILKSQGISLDEFRQKKIPLRLDIKVIFKRWEQKEERHMLENPPDQWYYDHRKVKWVHEPTTSEIQFPIFAERNDK